MHFSEVVTEESLISELTAKDLNSDIVSVVRFDSNIRLSAEGDPFNILTISADGKTVTFGDTSGGPTITSFTWKGITIQ